MAKSGRGETWEAVGERGRPKGMQGEGRLEGCRERGHRERCKERGGWEAARERGDPGAYRERGDREGAGRGKTQRLQGDGRLDRYKREDAGIPETR